uniref:Uncharacterized protein n=1 Tax=Anguilla anguilla TaxID=7936 RepID=A0A0E9VI35_ANGAN
MKVHTQAAKHTASHSHYIQKTLIIYSP